MRATTIARSYAETLLTLADRNGGAPTAEAFGRALEEVAALLAAEPRVRAFLETPRVDAAAKKEALERALQGKVPPLFLRFVQVVVDKRRQGLLREIAAQYAALADERAGRLRARVTLPQAPDAALQEEIGRQLEARFGKPVVATFAVDPALVGGIVVRVGDQTLDGSIRSRAAALRRHLMEAGTR